MRLEELLSDVVSPVLGELLLDYPLTEIAISSSSTGDEVRLRVATDDEVFTFWVRTPGQAPEPPGELRARLADQLQDWISESRRGWGQLRQHPFA